MSLLALLIAYAQAPVSRSEAAPSTYVIVGDEASKSRVEALFREVDGRRGSATFARSTSGADGSCTAAWRRVPSEREACLRAHMPRSGTTVIVDTYGQAERGGGVVVRCIGGGQSGEIMLQPQEQVRDAQRLSDCMTEARRGSPAPQLRRYLIRSGGQLSADVDGARARAAAVLRIAIDHVTVPRGTRGICRPEGRVTGVVRGAGFTPRGFVELAIPCAVEPSRTRSRSIWWGDVQAGNYANVYLDRFNAVIDFEAVPEGAVLPRRGSRP